MMREISELQSAIQLDCKVREKDLGVDNDFWVTKGKKFQKVNLNWSLRIPPISPNTVVCCFLYGFFCISDNVQSDVRHENIIPFPFGDEGCKLSQTGLSDPWFSKH